MKRLGRGVGLGLVGALALAACDARDPAPSHLYWARDLLELARADAPLPGLGPVQGIVAVKGQPLPPDATGQAPQQDPGQDGLVVAPAFVEGQPAAYFTTEVWYDATPVWLQPLYVPVTAYDEASPFSHAIPGAFVFAVGPETPFYSPFWRVVFVVVPQGTPAGRFRSEKALFDAGLEMHPGGLQLCIFLPGGTDPMGIAAPAGAAPKRPYNDTPATPLQPGLAWAEGDQVTVLGLGADRFQVLPHDLIEADALFHWVTRAANGALRETRLPSVGGTGPFGERREAAAPVRTSQSGVTGPSPHFGSLWRIYQVELPPTAAAFVLPQVFPTLVTEWRGLGVRLPGDDGVPAVAPLIAARPDVKDYVGRVALHPACFGDAAQFPLGCQFIDSQARLEDTLSQGAIHPTDAVVTCPLVVFQNQTVPPP